ncbi:serine/threonine protein kinase [Hyalangium minutum]|uniref:Serine/threonine protein kinase n=1 Tax=Hyalangium minutum TaxID=394096 RepID=A0A085VZH3_9BACT|nr:serine/threonine-protein kinase [Hyalangium minutum]KFE60836.1 Serine/threonine protein kinase [Hyalangium minutum]
MNDTPVTPFGKYELLERLGMGGMAIVYRARYTAAPGITKPVVIKKVLDVYAENPAFVELFIHEARISVGLNHGNIVQVFDFGQVNGEYFLAMELVEGQPLSRVLKKAQAMNLSKLPAPLAVNIAIEMCKGLHHAHTRADENGRPLGLVHRDISPDNVLISYDGQVKISDFGVAKAKLAGRPETEAGMVKGKYLYFSPEQAMGEQLDARSDVYAVGVVLFKMLCGRLPVEGPEIAVMQRIVQGRLTPALQLNPDLDPTLVDILEEAMAFKRDDRIPSAEALQHQLSHWMATKAPHFPAHTLKHMMGVLYEAELTALGRPPQVAERFREQMSRWSATQRWRALEEPAPEQASADGGPSVPEEVPSVDATKPESGGVTAEGTGTVVTATVANGQVGLPGLKTRYFWIVGVVAVALVGGVLGFLWKARVPPLEVFSTPLGAQVIVDGVPKGTTPLKLEGVGRKAPHTVELSLKGMRPWSQQFEAGALATRLDVTLEPIPPPPVPAPEPASAPVTPVAAAVAQSASLVGESFATRFGTEQVPARFTLEEKWHSFSTTSRSLQQALDPAQSYTVWMSGSYTGDAPISEQDLRQGMSLFSARSVQVFVFLEGEGIPDAERLFMATPRPHALPKARKLHAFVLVGITSEKNVDRNLTLHVRDNATKAVQHLKLESRRFAHQVALENRYSVRKLDPESWYAVDFLPREGVPSSAVAVLVVPTKTGKIQVNGQLTGELRYALRPGRYTLQGARELWFALPRSEEDGQAQMEVSVTAIPPPPPAPPVDVREVTPEEAGAVIEEMGPGH